MIVRPVISRESGLWCQPSEKGYWIEFRKEFPVHQTSLVRIGKRIDSTASGSDE